MKRYFKYKIIKLVLSTFIIGATFSSCTEDIDLELDSTYIRLAVDGAITTDTTAHKVVLSKSGDALNKLPIEYISGAVVTISDGSTVYPLTESASEKGVYETAPNVYGIPDKTYTLNISNVDINNDGVLENYTASSYLRKMLPIDSIQLIYQKFAEEEEGYAISLFGWDIGGRNFYLTKAEKNGVLLTDSIKEYGKAINDGFSGIYYEGFPVYYLSSNKIDERIKKGDTITLVLNSITQDYYNFIDGFQKEYQPKVPIFSGPSSNVITNIEPKDKAVGYFSAYSIQRKSKVFSGMEIIKKD
jgi:hypothetical protein